MYFCHLLTNILFLNILEQNNIFFFILR